MSTKTRTNRAERSGKTNRLRTILAIARAECRQIGWSKTVLVLVGVLSLSVWRVATSVQPIAGDDGTRGSMYMFLRQPETGDGVYAVYGFVSTTWHVNSLLFLLPLGGLLLGYGAIVTPRESGRLRMVLSLPCSRGAILIGTFLGRAVVFTLAMTIALAVGWLSITTRFATASPWRYLAFTVTTVAYGLVWVSLGIALSASFSTARRVAGTVFVVYVGGVIFNWYEALVGLLGRYPEGHVVDPQQAYLGLVATPYDELRPKVHADAAFGIDSLSRYNTEAATVATEAPAYFSWPVATLVLALWIVLPLYYARSRLYRMEFS